MKIISINIEGDKHLDRILQFFKQESPDIICLSEVFEEDLIYFASEFKYQHVFTHECYRYSMKTTIKKELKTFGIAILAKKIITSEIYYLSGASDKIPRFSRSLDLKDKSHHIAVPALMVETQIDSRSYFVTTTHLAVTANGEATEYQIRQAKNLLNHLNCFPDMIICGDLNAPRDGEVYSLFNCKYKDNIPAEYETSLDQSLHRVKGLKFVVDYMFSTKSYFFTNVKLIDGLSDHMAVVGEISCN